MNELWRVASVWCCGSLAACGPTEVLVQGSCAGGEVACEAGCCQLCSTSADCGDPCSPTDLQGQACVQGVCLPGCECLTTCAAENMACGRIPDGCGGQLDCGNCDASACQADSQCGAGQVCNLASGRCEQGKQVMALTCATSGDCAESAVCNTELHLCVSPCSADSDCVALPDAPADVILVCDTALGYCVPQQPAQNPTTCATSADCRSPQVCNTSVSVCVPSCATDSDCPPLPPDAPAGVTLSCDPSLGYCLPRLPTCTNGAVNPPACDHCPPGQFVGGSGCVADDAPLFDFGGMFGYGADAWGNSVAYVNPLTNGLNCPDSYDAAPVLGTGYLDFPVYFCFRPHQPDRPMQWDFGGVFGYYWDGYTSQVYPNPATGAASCPAGYGWANVLYTPNLDMPLAFCYRAHTIGVPGALSLGGMYGWHWDGANSVPYVNPATWGPYCPAGHTEATVFGTPSLDYAISICYR